MLAVRLHGNSDLRVDQMPEPDAAGPGQVRVEPQWCGICGTDLHIFHGDMDARVGPPAVIGHEMSGRIADLGDGVDRVAPRRELRPRAPDEHRVVHGPRRARVAALRSPPG